MRAFKARQVGGICAGLVLTLVATLGFSASALADTKTFAKGQRADVAVCDLRAQRRRMFGDAVARRLLNTHLGLAPDTGN